MPFVNYISRGWKAQNFIINSSTSLITSHNSNIMSSTSGINDPINGPCPPPPPPGLPDGPPVASGSKGKGRHLAKMANVVSDFKCFGPFFPMTNSLMRRLSWCEFYYSEVRVMFQRAVVKHQWVPGWGRIVPGAYFSLLFSGLYFGLLTFKSKIRSTLH